MPAYEAVIGLEVHVQLATATKLFCSCPTSFGQAPNSNVCEVCGGMPGALPMLTRQAVHYACLVGLATNCSIHRNSIFFIHLIYDRSRTSHRLITEINRSHRLNTAQAMMIDNLQDICFFHSVDCLIFFIMVN